VETGRFGYISKTAQESVREHLREVMERYKLPSLPVVVSKVLIILKDPDFSVRQLSRVIAADAALTGRTLAISRSPRYAQRRQPSSVHEAILVLGFHTLRNIVMAAAAQSFISRTNKVAKQLWRHSLAAALAARMLSERSGIADPELAFLAGLLHDVGEIVLLNGDPRGFEQMVEEVQQSNGSLVIKEREQYAFDHASIGLALLDYWDIDERIGQAAYWHHYDGDGIDADSLVSILKMADHLCFKVDLGFVSEPPPPTAEMAHVFGCEDAESLEALAQEVRKAFDEESQLFASA
jgi:putative nucleotidyltransferase with HDIG domain